MLSRPLLERLAKELVRFEKNSRKSAYLQAEYSFIQQAVRFGLVRDDQFADMKRENTRLRAQLQLLQSMLTPKATTPAASTEGTTSAQQIPEAEREPKEAKP